MRKAELRLPIYALFEKLIGRKMIAVEHEELKAHIVAYANNEVKENTQLRLALSGQAQKMDKLRKMYSALKSKTPISDEKFNKVMEALVPFNLLPTAKNANSNQI